MELPQTRAPETLDDEANCRMAEAADAICSAWQGPVKMLINFDVLKCENFP